MNKIRKRIGIRKKVIIEHREYKKRKPYDCKRCKARFITKEELDIHKECFHGDISVENHLNAKDSIVYRIWMKYYNPNAKKKKSIKSKAIVIPDIHAPYSIDYGNVKAGEVKCESIFDDSNKDIWPDILEEDKIYSGKSWCKNTSKESANKFFKELDDMNERMKDRNSKYIIPSEQERCIYGGNLKSKDNIYIGYWYVYDKDLKKYEMRTSWGSLIRYYDDIGSFCPEDMYKNHKKRKKVELERNVEINGHIIKKREVKN